MRNNITLTGVLLVLMLACGSSAWAFGPGPDLEAMAAERDRLVKLREELGERRFDAYVIARLNLFADIRLPDHPEYEARSLQLGTPEHFAAQHPHFLTQAPPLLAEMDDSRALPALTRLLKLYQHWYNHRLNQTGRLGYGLDAQWAAVKAAWFHISLRNRWVDETIQAYTEIGMELQAYQHIVRIDLDRPEDDDQRYLDYSIHDPEEDDLLETMVKSIGYRGQGTGLSLIKTVAHHGEWYLTEKARAAYLSSDDQRLRLAVVCIDYIQQVANKGLNDGRPGAPVSLLLELDAAGLELEDADHARLQLATLWRELLDERQALHGNPPPVVPGGLQHDKAHREYGRKIEKNTERLDQLASLIITPWSPISDLSFMDLVIETAPYNKRIAVFFRNAAARERIELTAEQLDQLTEILGDPWVNAYVKKCLAEALFRMDHRPAADAIYSLFNDMNLLDGFTFHPKVIRNASSPFGLDLIAWLKEHAEQTQGDGVPDH